MVDFPASHVSFRGGIQDVEWMSLQTNLYQKINIKEKTESSIPQSQNCCACFRLQKMPTHSRKNSPSQQGHIDLAMARTRSWRWICWISSVVSKPFIYAKFWDPLRVQINSIKFDIQKLNVFCSRRCGWIRMNYKNYMNVLFSLSWFMINDKQ